MSNRTVQPRRGHKIAAVVVILFLALGVFLPLLILATGVLWSGALSMIQSVTG